MPKPFTVGQILTAALANDLVAIYDRNATNVTVVNTTVETEIWSKVIGAGHMSTDRMLRLRLLADFLNNTGAANDFTLRLKADGVTIWTMGGTAAFTSSATRRSMRFTAELVNLGANNVQQLVTALIGSALSDDTPSLHHVNASEIEALDTSVAVTLSITVTLEVASANLEFRKRHVLLELL